jgi:hypothetical protein
LQFRSLDQTRKQYLMNKYCSIVTVLVLTSLFFSPLPADPKLRSRAVRRAGQRGDSRRRGGSD